MSDTIIHTQFDGNVLVIETADGAETFDERFLVAALLIFVAKGSGGIEPEESAKMLELLEDHSRIPGSEALELLTRAIGEMAERPGLGASLANLAHTLPAREQENIALMALKVIAADGRREVEEMEQFNRAVEAAGITSDIVHRAYDRYFAETMPDTDY